MEAKCLGDMFRRAASRHPEKAAQLVPSKDGVEAVSYEQAAAEVRRFAQRLQDLGVRRGDRVCIFAENSPEWALFDWACQSLGVVSVPIYPTLPSDQASYIVRDAGARLVLCGSVELAQRVSGLEGVETMLLKDDPSSLEQQATTEMSLDAWNAEIDATRPDDVATIIYTSGTTGVPKGVVITHRAFTSLCESALTSLPIGPDDTLLSFLPLSHVFERFAGHALPVSMGATVGYAKSLASLGSDMQKVRPTFMLVVPRFLEATMDKVLDNVKKQSPLKQRIFHAAVSQGARRAKGRFAPLAGLLDKIALSKVRDRLGGRLRFFVSGGAALPAHVADFYAALGVTVLQGYGLTETCAATCVNRPERNRPWTVGEPLTGMEVKIAEDGEILIRGPGVMVGYYNLPEETAQAIDSEGWFHTGDIGEFEGPCLKITDRKKDILVLGNGKNIAPQAIENKLKSSPFIAEAVVFGDGMDHCVALVLPNEPAVRAELGIAENARLVDDPQVKALIKREIDRINKTLASFELVKRHALLETPFTIESGELTPSMKVRRKVVKEKHQDLIKSLG